MAEQQIRYCTTEDGVRIAYAVEGEGYPLVYTVGWIDPIELGWAHPGLWNSFGEFVRNFALVRFDRRGVGLSDRDVSDFSIEARERDLTAVVEALQLDRFALYAASEAGPVAVKYTAGHPHRVSHLILHGSFAYGLAVWRADVIKSLAALVRAEWGLGSAALTRAFIAEDEPEMGRWFTLLQRKGAHREEAARILEQMPQIDVRQLLPTIRAPTLVVHGTDDAVVPFVNGQDLAAGIPEARLIPYRGMHFLGAGPGDVEVRRQIMEFISGKPVSIAPPPPAAVQAPLTPFRTVLFTDLVGHTEMMTRLGDEQGRAVLREHERITREVLRAHDGAEIKTMGDGFMASFGSVTRAMDCAIALQRAFATHTASMPEPLHVRVGLNAGEPIEEEGDLFGASVIIASRVAAQAGAGEILVPEPVRHLLAGKSFVFADRGEVLLKGFEDAVRLFEVRWRE